MEKRRPSGVIHLHFFLLLLRPIALHWANERERERERKWRRQGRRFYCRSPVSGGFVRWYFYLFIFCFTIIDFYLPSSSFFFFVHSPVRRRSSLFLFSFIFWFFLCSFVSNVFFFFWSKLAAATSLRSVDCGVCVCVCEVKNQRWRRTFFFVGWNLFIAWSEREREKKRQKWKKNNVPPNGTFP